MFIEIGTLSLVIAASAPSCGAGQHLVSAHSLQHKAVMTGPLEPKMLFSATLESALAADFALNPHVQAVFAERAEGNLLVWIAVDNPTREIREKVFQKQFDLIDGFPEVSFDFNIIARRDRSPQEFASEAKLIYSREG